MLRQQLVALCGFDDATRQLTALYCSGTSQELPNWFDSVEFEALPPELTCMAAVAGSSAQFSGVPQALVPRLRGIIKYVHTLNSGMMAGVCALAAALNGEDISVLLLEDTALYMRHTALPQRHLWQMCIGVRKSDYERTLDIARTCGFTVEIFENAAALRQGVTRQITVIPLDETSFLWQGAQELKKGNAVFLCPAPAAILIAISQRAFRSLTKKTSRVAMVRWCMDVKLLSELMTQADWQCASQIAACEHAENHMCLLFAAYHAITGIDPSAQAPFGSERDVRRTLRLLQSLRRCPEPGHRLRRRFLLCRLRRPDSLAHSCALFLKGAARKLGF